MKIKSSPGPVTNDGSIHRMTVIPSYNGPKYQTTNRQGTTYSGMGTSIYSRIGSSGLAPEEQASKLEAMLSKQGLRGVKVLMIGDTAVIGAQQEEASGIHPLQRKLLSPFAGMSGTSNKHTTGSTVVRSNTEKAEELEQARLHVQALLGGHARVLTVTHPDALAAMERVRTKPDANPSASVRSDKTHRQDDMALILKHAKGK